MSSCSSWGFLDISRPDRICNPFTVFWVDLGPLLSRACSRIYPQGGTKEAYWMLHDLQLQLPFKIRTLSALLDNAKNWTPFCALCFHKSCRTIKYVHACTYLTSTAPCWMVSCCVLAKAEQGLKFQDKGPSAFSPPLHQQTGLIQMTENATFIQTGLKSIS